MEKKPEVKLMIAYSPHTTSLDAERLGKIMGEFNPDVVIPWERGRTPPEIAKLEAEEVARLRGELEYEKSYPLFKFRDKLLQIRKKQLKESGKDPRVHFVEVYPTKEGAMKQSETYAQSAVHRKNAMKLFKQNNVEQACEELRKCIEFRAKSANISMENIENRAKKLQSELLEKYPELKAKKEIRAIMYISTLFAPQLSLQAHKKQKIPGITQMQLYPFISTVPYYEYSTFIGELLKYKRTGERPTEEQLKKILIEETIEPKLRKLFPGSTERFRITKKMAETFVREKEPYASVRESLKSKKGKAWEIRLHKLLRPRRKH